MKIFPYRLIILLLFSLSLLLPFSALQASATFDLNPSVSFSVAVIGAADFCEEPFSLSNCDASIPNAQNTLTVEPGETIYLEYGLENTSSSPLIEAQVEDDRYGTIFDGPINLNPGPSLNIRSLQTAPTAAGTYVISVTCTAADAGGNTVTVQSSYTLIIPEPAADFSVAVIGAADFCEEPFSLSNCDASIPNAQNTLTAEPGETIYLEYGLGNTGSSPLTEAQVEDDRYGTIFDGPINLNPGPSLNIRSLQTAPTAAGTYVISVTCTAADAGGNTVTVQSSYTLIIPEPAADFSVAVIGAADFCEEPFSLSNCDASIPNAQNTLTVEPGETIYLEYGLENTSSSPLTEAQVEDDRYGTIFDGPINLNPGPSLNIRSLQTAPTAAGTYVISVTCTAADAGGNTVTVQSSYTLIIPEPAADFSVAVIGAADFCEEPFSLSNCDASIPNAQNTLTAEPGETIYLEYGLENTGSSPLTEAQVEDDRYGTIFDGPINLNPGPSLNIRSLQTAPTAPGIYVIPVILTVADAGGNMTTAMATYTIIVEGPNANFRVLLGDGDDFCTNESNLATCSALPASAPGTLTLIQNEAYLLEYDIENTGTTTLTTHTIIDDALGTVVNNQSFSLAAGQTTRFSQLLVAPSSPGTYPIDVTYEGTDQSGESVVKTTSYTLIVLELAANFEVAVVTGEDLCTTPGDLSSCGILFPSNPNTVSVAPGAEIYLEYQLTEAGDVSPLLHAVIDNQYGTVIQNDFFDISFSGNRVYRSLETAPTTPGTYTYTANYTGQDGDGNAIQRQASYTLIVGCPEECFIQGPTTVECAGSYTFSADYDDSVCSDGTVIWSITDAAGGIATYTGNPVAIPLSGCAENYSITAEVTCPGCPAPVTCSTSVQVEDTTAPDVVCTLLEDTIEACPAGLSPEYTIGLWLPVEQDGTIAVPVGGSYTSTIDISNCLSDNCANLDELEFSVNEAYEFSATPGCSLTIATELVFRDACGNASSTILSLLTTFEQSNPIPPSITPPADVTVECGDSTEPAATGSATASSACGGVSVNFSDATVAGCGNTSVITRTWTATNDCGLSTSADQIITIEDTTKPKWNQPTPDVTITTEGDGASCPGVADTDLVQDRHNPIATGNTTVEYTIHGLTFQTPNGSASDSCTEDEDLTVYVWKLQTNFNNAATDYFRQIRVVFRLYDDCGNFRNRDIIYTIIDDTPPVLNCLPGTTLNFNGEEFFYPEDFLAKLVDLDNTYDECGDDDLYYSFSPDVFSCDQLGETINLTLEVCDGANNCISCEIPVTIGGLPCGWSQQPDGIGCEDGSLVDYEVDNEVFTVNSTNCHNPISTTTDEYAFAQYNLCGNGEIIAQVTGISGTSFGWAGVIMRESNDPASKSVALTTNLAANHRREARVVTGGTMTSQLMPSYGRHWLRIERFGSQFRAYTSFNGVSWFLRFAQTIAMDECLEVGLVVNGYNGSGQLSATFENVSVQGSTFFEFQANEPAVEEAVATKTFSVFPNPTTGQVTITLGDFLEQEIRLEVLDVNGQRVQLVREGILENSTEKLDLGQLPAGLYFLRLQLADGTVQTQRVVLQPRP